MGESDERNDSQKQGGKPTITIAEDTESAAAENAESDRKPTITIAENEE